LMLLGVASRRLGLPSFLKNLFAPRPTLAVAQPNVVATDARVEAVTKTKSSQKPIERAPVARPIAVDRSVDAPTGNAASVAASIAQKRKEQLHKVQVAPVIASASKKKPPTGASEGAGSLADLAKKRREKKS
jgi:hypothetical protein